MEKELAKESISKVNIKTGKGGLVDIEFIVQMLQLRHGKKYPSIRHGNTLMAIEALGKKHLLEEDEVSSRSDEVVDAVIAATKERTESTEPSRGENE